MLEYHPYAVDVDRHDINKKNMERIETLCEGKTTIRFVWMGDTQRRYDETRDMVKSINNRDDIDFVMHGGDISDFGLNREFDWIEDIMEELKSPHVSLVGNHDLLGNGKHVFEAMYGVMNYSFIAGNTKIVCLNTNALELDYSLPVPDYEFMRSEVADSAGRDYHQTIVAMHAPPLSEQFDNNTVGMFQHYVKSFKNILFCTHAHTHSYSVKDIFDDGIIYYGCDSMRDRSYIVFTVKLNSYSHEIIYF
jgi:Icc-related predicted phosphoesterase